MNALGIFQVSLTVDCGMGSNTGEGEESLILHEQEENSSPVPEPSSPTKKAGTTIRGIFTKWRSSSQEASVDKGEEGQRLTSGTGAEPSSSAMAKGRESSIFGLLPLVSLRNATSRESLQGGSGPCSQINSPTGSPSFLAKQVTSSRLISLSIFPITSLELYANKWNSELTVLRRSLTHSFKNYPSLTSSFSSLPYFIIP